MSEAKPPEFRAERIEFSCPHCSGTAVMHPQRRPIAVQHSLPQCSAFEQASSEPERLLEYLQRAGLPMAHTN